MIKLKADTTDIGSAFNFIGIKPIIELYTDYEFLSFRDKKGFYKKGKNVEKHFTFENRCVTINWKRKILLNKKKGLNEK